MAAKVSVAEIVRHALPDDCWMVVNGKVYDLTSFAPNHPGGPDVIYRWAGKDASQTYNEYHAETLIEKELPDSDKKGDFDESTVTETWIEAQKQEVTSRADPNEKPPLSFLINLDDFVQAFSKAASEKANAYVVGASNDILTFNANVRDWQKLWFRPRIMRNVSKVNTRTKMLGVEVAMPLWICPMGVAKTAGQEGEKALARGAAAAGIVHCLAVTASLSVDEVVGSTPANPFFYQLYVDKQRHKSEEQLKKLNTMPQIKALFVTVDLPMVSKREADERVRSQEVTSLYMNGQQSGVDKKGGGLARSTGSFIDWALCWDDLAWIRRHTSLPIVLKGVQSVADAKMAVKLGCAGIVVSNHGGRALDSAPSSISVLLELRRDYPDVFTELEVFVDGGIRRGSDILKAYCLGAKGVGIGRPFQCAVAYGTEGVEHCAEIVQDELETAMRLCGVTDLESVRGDMSYLNATELEQLLPPKREKYPPLRSSWKFWPRL